VGVSVEDNVTVEPFCGFFDDFKAVFYSVAMTVGCKNLMTIGRNNLEIIA